MDGLGSIPSLLQEFETGTWKRGQMPLFGVDNDPVEDWSIERKAVAQKQLLGVSLIEHPLDRVADQIAAANAISTLEAAGRVNQEVRVAGLRQTWRRTQTARGAYLYFMDLGDLEGTIRVMIDEELYARSRSQLAGHLPILVEGRLELPRDAVEPVLNASRVVHLDQLN
jgi:DNA polymerase III alpha subunit